jgi:hypothetical protein
MVRTYVHVGIAEATARPPALDEVGISHPSGLRTNRKRRKKGDDRRRRMHMGDQRGSSLPEPRVYCPCSMCATRDEPTARLLEIVEEHLELYGMSSRWKVWKISSAFGFTSSSVNFVTLQLLTNAMLSWCMRNIVNGKREIP